MSTIHSLALAVIVGLSAIITPARANSTITVTTVSDVIASDGLCSLREAIIAANTDSAFGDCAGGSGADTIGFGHALPVPASFVLTRSGANEDGALTGDLDIAGTLTISGMGVERIIIDGHGTDRVVEIRPGAHVTITGMTIRNGNPDTAGDGGGIKVLGALTLSESAVSTNQGGGVRNDGGLLNLTNVNIMNNSGGYGLHNQNGAYSDMNGGVISGNQGGGVYNTTSSVSLSNSRITNNTGGAGVYNSGTVLTRLTLNQCAVISNTATSGGGIFNEGIGATANIYNSQITSNTATVAGGGVYNNGIMTLNGSTIDHNRARSGGGIDHSGGNLYLTNDTLSSNAASDNGGGLYNRGSAILTNITFSSNAASGPSTGGNIFNDTAQLSIRNTVVAYSEADGNCFNSDGFLNSLGHNLDSASTCGFNATGDMANTDPLLGPLQDNGGATLTHALLPGSPALDKGDDALCPATDQRGLARPQGAACDIGAYEAGASGGYSIYLPAVLR